MCLFVATGVMWKKDNLYIIHYATKFKMYDNCTMLLSTLEYAGNSILYKLSLHPVTIRKSFDGLTTPNKTLRIVPFIPIIWNHISTSFQDILLLTLDNSTYVFYPLY